VQSSVPDMCITLQDYCNIRVTALRDMLLNSWYLVGRASWYNFFIITNLIHKFFVHLHKLYEIKFLYMFRAQSAHHQEVNEVNCTYAASGIVTLCKWLSCSTAKDGLFLSSCTRRWLAESEDTRGCICTICFVDLLMMSGLRSKHVEEFNFILFMWMDKKFVYQVGNNKKVTDVNHEKQA
jgi:hypothetical protein